MGTHITARHIANARLAVSAGITGPLNSRTLAEAVFFRKRMYGTPLLAVHVGVAVFAGGHTGKSFKYL